MPATNSTRPRLRWLLAFVEVALIFLLFFVWAGSPPPGDDEAHYLGKAKHYWNPQWCPDDFFLGSPDAHQVFNWTIGWLTLFFSLPAVAWIGRVTVWWLLAWSWRRLSFAVVPRPFMSLLTVSLYLIFREYGHMAREWIVGGIEAKCLAYIFVFLGLEALVRNRWKLIWPLLGIASAFHVLVGGWSVVAAALAWLITRRRPGLAGMLPWIFLGGILSLPGLVPGILLTWGVDAKTVRIANEIYVFDRLSHHLVFHLFPRTYIARFLSLLAAWLVLCFLTRKVSSSLPLRRFVLSTVVIAIVGGIIDLATYNRQEIAAALLRYYWFRLADVMVPLGLAMAIAESIRMLAWRHRAWAQCALVAASLIPLAVIPVRTYWRLQDLRPGADVQGGIVNHDDWVSACDWIRDNTRPADRFLTPPSATSFRWYAGRSEVVSFKDIPQDAEGIVAWWKRLKATRQWWYRAQTARNPADHDLGQLRQMAKDYGVQYVVVDRRRVRTPLPLVREYPANFQPNKTYAVYRIPPPDARP